MSNTYQESVERTIIAAEQLHQIVNGTATTEVPVQDGSKIPSIRKALIDNFYFKEPLAWQQGQSETVFNQLRKTTDGLMWYAPNASIATPVLMGVEPTNASGWNVYSLDAIVKLSPTMIAALKRTYKEVGLELVNGSFDEGAVVTNVDDIVLQLTTGKCFNWQGSLPKTIPNNSTPEGTGGIGINKWQDVTNTTLRVPIEAQVRESLRRSYSAAGYNLVAGSFEAGGTLSGVYDVLLQESSGRAYSGANGFVPAGTNPLSGGFTDRSNVLAGRYVRATDVGIKTTNTPAKNTAALNDIRAIGGIGLYIPAGTFQFDVFATTGLSEVCGAGKTSTIVEVSGASSAAMVQPGPITHKGIWFKSIAGSKDSCSVNITNYSKFENCKISDFIHTVPTPNAWGVYLDKIKGARLTNVEFEGNSQADIAIVEGVSDVIIDGCFHTTGQLHINIEPNNGAQPIYGVLLRNMAINKLSLLCNDLNYATDCAVVVQGCHVNQLRYDGLGVSFIETKIDSFFNQTDSNNRLYGANITGIKVGSKELVPDPAFSDVGDAGSKLPWSVISSTTPAVNRYNRDASGDLVVGVNSVAQATTLTSQPIPCKASTPYLFTICKMVKVNAGRPNVVSVMFHDANGVDIGTRFGLPRKFFTDTFDRHQHIVVSPSNAASMSVRVSNGDSTVDFQSITYRYFSVREINGQGIGIDSSTIGDIKFPTRIRLKFTKAQVDSLQYYHAPLPVGTEIEFAYAAGVDVTRLARVTEQAADNTGRFGTLLIIAKYL